MQKQISFEGYNNQMHNQTNELRMRYADVFYLLSSSLFVCDLLLDFGFRYLSRLWIGVD